MADTSNIVVVGCGAVGTMCAYAIQTSKKATITAVIRSAYSAVKADGFSIKSIDHGDIDNWKPHNIVPTIEDARDHGPFDFVVVALKSLPDAYSIPEMISPLVTPGSTNIVLVQNGIDIEQPVVTAFPKNPVISGVPLIGSEMNGTVVLQNDPDVLLIGAVGNKGSQEAQQKACERFAQLYNAGGAKAEIKEDITWFRWRKLVWNASFNTVCALTSLDSGVIQEVGGLDTLIRPAMREVIAIAAAAGYELPVDVEEQMVKFTPREIYLKPSMQVDAARGRPMEVEVILGNALQKGQSLGVQSPTLDMLYRLLKAKQKALLRT